MEVVSLLLFRSSELYLLFSKYILQLCSDCSSIQICLIEAAIVFLDIIQLDTCVVQLPFGLDICFVGLSFGIDVCVFYL